MWQNLKNTERFEFVDPEKIAHVAADDAVSDSFKDYEWLVICFSNKHH